MNSSNDISEHSMESSFVKSEASVCVVDKPRLSNCIKNLGGKKIQIEEEKEPSTELHTIQKSADVKSSDLLNASSLKKSKKFLDVPHRPSRIEGQKFIKCIQSKFNTEVSLYISTDHIIFSLMTFSIQRLEPLSQGFKSEARCLQNLILKLGVDINLSYQEQRNYIRRIFHAKNTIINF